MKVILTKDIQSLGEAGDVVEVKDGYARNFLLPQNIVEIATPGALKNREQNLVRIKAKAEKLHQEALNKAETVKSLGEIQISAKAGENGKLFGAVTTKKLSEEIAERSGIVIDRRSMSLNAPINHIGQYSLLIKMTSKVSFEVPIMVNASEVIKESIIEEVEAAELAAAEEAAYSEEA